MAASMQATGTRMRNHVGGTVPGLALLDKLCMRGSCTDMRARSCTAQHRPPARQLPTANGRAGARPVGKSRNARGRWCGAQPHLNTGACAPPPPGLTTLYTILAFTYFTFDAYEAYAALGDG